MSFFILGLNHKTCPVEIREKLHFTSRSIAETLEQSKSISEIAELVILSTCNRVELYGFSETGSFPEEQLFELLENAHGLKREQFREYLYRYEAKAAVSHLFRVAAGLDSLVIGENEILGQVRDAFRQANAVGSVHSLLYRLIEKALKVGKEVRTKTKINEGAVSVPSVAVELAEKIFGRLQGEKVMVLGTGEMSVMTLENLRNAGGHAIYVVSRSEEPGKNVAAEFDARWLSMKDWEKKLEEVDILIASTSAPHAIVHKEQVKRAMEARRYRPLLLIDIAVPRNIDASINQLDDVYLYNIDDLKGVSASNLRLRRKELVSAEQFCTNAVIHFQGWLERLKARPTLERFEGFLEELLSKEFDRLGRSANLDETKKEEVKQRIRAKLLHAPFEKIKQASENGGVSRYLEALHSLFDLDDEEG